MSIILPQDKKVQLIESIKHYFEENMESEVGDLKDLLLCFLVSIRPSS